MEKAIEKIKKDKWYSARFLIVNEVFPWIKSLSTLIRWVESNQELFKPIIKEGKTGKRYHFKGETILELLEKANSGELEVQSFEETNEQLKDSS